MGVQAVTLGRDLVSVSDELESPVALRGALCKKCGRHFFPSVELCAVCESEEIEPVTLGRKGKLWSFTICHFPPPGGKYSGPVPFTAGIVALDEGILIQTRLVGGGAADFEPDMRVELCLDSWKDRDGTEVICHAYRTVEN